MSLAIETIPCDHGTPLSHARRAIEREDRTLVALDTEFLAHHDQLEEALQAERLWDRVRHVHLKDYDRLLWSSEQGRRYLHPGEGRIDFPLLFQRLAQRAFSGTVSLEASGMDQSGRVDVARIQESITLLRKWLDGAVGAHAAD